jgi:hypothetical protein
MKMRCSSTVDKSPLHSLCFEKAAPKRKLVLMPDYDTLENPPQKRTVSRMKSAASTALVCILFYGCLSGQALTHSQRLPNMTDKVLTGEFVGMEQIEDYEPGRSGFTKTVY